MSLNLISLILAFIVLIISVVTDIKYHKIFNYITFPAIIIGLLLALIQNPEITLVRFAWMIGCFFFGMLGLMGLGDLKLIMTVISLRGYMEGIFMLLFGGIAMIIYLLIKEHDAMTRSLKETAKSFIYRSDMLTRTGKKYPFAPFLAFGYAISFLFVHFIF